MACTSDSVLHIKSKPPLPYSTTTINSTPKRFRFFRLRNGASSAPR